MISRLIKILHLDPFFIGDLLIIFFAFFVYLLHIIISQVNKKVSQYTSLSFSFSYSPNAFS